MNKKYYLLLGLILVSGWMLSAQEVSRFAYLNDKGCMEYIADEENNYIPDFSHAGYKGGGVTLPDVPTVLTLEAIAGDNTAAIQAAIDSIAQMPVNEQGIRGALQLNAGVYEIHGQLFINQNGITLRGVGSDIDTTQNTILRGIGNTPSQRDLIIAGNSTIWDWKDRLPNSTTDITNPFLPAGSRSVMLSSVDKFQIGDEIVVYQPSTEKWLSSINYGDTGEDAPWNPGEIDLYYQRKVDAIVPEENKIILDAPIYDHLDNSLAQSSIYKLNEPNIRTNIGIENLRIKIETEGEETENHVKNGILLKGVRNAWVQGVTVLHFMYAAIYTRAATNVTVRNCQGLVPHSQITGARRYNFDTDAYSNHILFEKCHASYGRHSFVSNGTSSASGIVFYDCTTEHDYNASEGHRRWSQGMLFDNITFTEPETTNLLGLYNRGHYGTGHGWSAVNSVAWNVNMNSTFRRLLIQKPPHRQNYAIGCFALLTNVHQFTHPIGAVNLPRKSVTPNSLYHAQLVDRLANGHKPDAPAKLEVRFDENSQFYQLEWLDIAADETGYIVQLATPFSDFQEVGSLPKNTTTFDFELPDSLQIGTFRVVATKENCLSAYSNPVTIELTVSDKEIALPGVSIYPNPTTDFLLIKSEIAIEKLKVYNQAGLRQQTPWNKTNSIDLSNLEKGWYYLELQDRIGRKGIYKFIKS